MPDPLDPNDPEVHTAVFGQMVEDFLQTEIGMAIAQHANDEALAALDEFRAVSAWDGTKVAQIQNRLWRAESIRSFLLDAITKGEQAKIQLEESRGG